MSKKKFMFFLMVLVTFLAYCQADTIVPKKLKQFSNHLMFLGYSIIATSEDSVSFKHDQFLDQRLLIYHGGVLFTSWWIISDEGKKSKSEMSLFINTLNKNSIVTKYYIDDDGDLAVEAWYPGEYDSKRFSVFIESIQQDWDYVDDTFKVEIQKYFK